jgi:hypothetical protein
MKKIYTNEVVFVGADHAIRQCEKYVMDEFFKKIFHEELSSYFLEETVTKIRIDNEDGCYLYLKYESQRNNTGDELQSISDRFSTVRLIHRLVDENEGDLEVYTFDVNCDEPILVYKDVTSTKTYPSSEFVYYNSDFLCDLVRDEQLYYAVKMVGVTFELINRRSRDLV